MIHRDNQIMQNTFKKLLWRAGFVTQIGGRVEIDKQKAQNFLSCSRRTLNRWIDKDDACPRAISLLKIKERVIPDSWRGFYFDRMERLHWQATQAGFTPSDIRRLCSLHAENSKNKQHAENLSGLVGELRDNNASKIAKQKLVSLSNLLHEVINEPIFNELNASFSKRG